MPLSAFGPRAEAYARRLPPHLDAIVFDELGFAEALDDALVRAFQAGPVLAAPVIGDRRSQVALDAVPGILRTHSAYWERRRSFDLLRKGELTVDGKPQAGREALTKKERDSIGDVLLASDCVVVRSWTELQRLSTLVGYRPIRCRRAVAQPCLAAPRFEARRGANAIVVWAPEMDALRAAIFALALEELKAPVVILCSDAAAGASLGLRARFVDAHDRAAVDACLDQAAALIDAEPDDPASAIALAGSGIPLAASFTSGAFEYVDGLYHYDAWDFGSILHGALAALGGEPPVLRETAPRPEDLAAVLPGLRPPAVGDPPLVSVVMATLNRHGVLPRAIDSVARQTYPNIELIVVNDGGKPVDAIVEGLPRVTILNNERPQGVLRATNLGFKSTRGKYVVYLSDDDYLFPGHVSRLVYALERTAGAVAVGMCAESYLQRGDDGYYDFIGTSIRMYRSTDPTVLRTVPFSIAITAMAVRRDAAEAAGEWDERTGIYLDYEWHLRFLERYDFLWISHLVANMDSRLDQSSLSGQAAGNRAPDLTTVWERHSAAGRPDIEAARRDLLLFYRGGEGTAPPQRGVTRIREPRRAVYRLD